MKLISKEQLDNGSINLTVEESYFFGLIKIKKQYLGVYDYMYNGFYYFDWYNPNMNLIFDIQLSSKLDALANKAGLE